MRALYLNVATTGLDLAKDRIVEIGITEAINGELTGCNFHHYIYPDSCSIEQYAVEVNGYGLDFLIDKPSFGDIADEFIRFVQDAEVVCFRTAFDVGFVNAEFNRNNRPLLETLCRKVTDLCAIAKKIAPKEPTLMRKLLEKYRIEVDDYTIPAAKHQSTLLFYRLHTAIMKASSETRQAHD